MHAVRFRGSARVNCLGLCKSAQVHKVRITQWWKLNRNWEVTTLFFTRLGAKSSASLQSCRQSASYRSDILRYTFQLFWSAVVYSFGDVFRLPWYTNLAPRLSRCEGRAVPDDFWPSDVPMLPRPDGCALSLSQPSSTPALHPRC